MTRRAVENRRWSMKCLPKKKGGYVVLKGRRKMEKTEKPKVQRPGTEDKKGPRTVRYTAEEKCRAVLTVWTERRKPTEVCQELGVAWHLLNQWQERAMEGMLLALQPQIGVRREMALNPRLAVLLERKSKGEVMKKLERRLVRLQEGPAKPGETGA
jgi:transposase-like protein